VALDTEGNIAAATSTGARSTKLQAAGRLVTDRMWMLRGQPDRRRVDHRLGEPIMKLVLAKWAADRVATGSLPEWVAAEAINYLKDRVNGHGGMILLDARGALALRIIRRAWLGRLRPHSMRVTGSSGRINFSLPVVSNFSVLTKPILLSNSA